MLSKSKASPCILTLILSFVLSDYLINLMNCKLKKYISYGLVSPHLENPADFPKPVFIWRGLCRNTPQLIYKNVSCNMKKIAITFMILGFNLGFSQVETPFFEQIAFDFYKDTIVKEYPSEKKIRIPKYAVDLHPDYYRFQVDECLTGEFLDEKTNLQ